MGVVVGVFLNSGVVFGSPTDPESQECFRFLRPLPQPVQEDPMIRIRRSLNYFIPAPFQWVRFPLYATTLIVLLKINKKGPRSFDQEPFSVLNKPKV